MSDPQALHAEIMAYDEADVILSPVPFLNAVKAVLELHKPIGHDLWSSEGKCQGWQCEECASRCHSGSGLSCDQPLDAEYPCETVKVISAALGVTTDG